MSQANISSPMLTASDVARLLSLHVNTVRRWTDNGLINAYRIGSRGDRRYRQEDISIFLASHSTVYKPTIERV